MKGCVCVEDLTDPPEVWWRADAGGAVAAAGASGHGSGAEQTTEPQAPAEEKTRGGSDESAYRYWAQSCISNALYCFPCCPLIKVDRAKCSPVEDFRLIISADLFAYWLMNTVCSDVLLIWNAVFCVLYSREVCTFFFYCHCSCKCHCAGCRSLTRLRTWRLKWSSWQRQSSRPSTWSSTPEQESVLYVFPSKLQAVQKS